MSNREKIIDAAAELIHKKGYFLTTVDEILDKTAVRKSNFYYYFKSKEELALEILEMRIRSFEEGVVSTTLRQTSLSPKARLRRFFDKIVGYHKRLKCTRGCPFGNLAIEMSEINETFRQRLAKFFESWERDIEGCIAEGIRQGEFLSHLNPRQVASLILSHLEGAILLVKTYRRIGPLLEGSRLLLELIEKDGTLGGDASTTESKGQPFNI
jgi:TetR/AcrR family transcriptional repressor of nem operon